MKRKDIVFGLLIIVILFGSNFLFRYDSKVSSVFKKNVFANGSCIITGSSYSNADALSVKATGNDATSGIDTWYCYNINNRSWSVCNNSTNCSSMTFSGWNDITKVKVTDKAGNTSYEKNLYSYYDAVYSGSRTNGSSFTISDNDYYNAVHIDTYRASTGTITKVDVKDSSSRDSLIYVTGYPEEVVTGYTTQEVKTLATTEKKYTCQAGTPRKLTSSDVGKTTVYVNGTARTVTSTDVSQGKYICESESYRLQNETCICNFKILEYNSDKSIKKVQDITDGKTSCIRTKTYCSDEYDKNMSTDNIYSVVTNTKENTQSASSSSYSNSNLYYRPDGSTCYTYYKGVSQVLADYYPSLSSCFSLYESYSCFTSNVKHFLENEEHFPVSNNVKNIMVNASKSTTVICGNDTTKVVKGSDYYSAHRSVNVGDEVGLCPYLADLINSGKGSDILGTRTSEESDGYQRYLVPFISSATCQYRPGFADVEYVKTCSDGSSPVNGYCTTTEKVEIIDFEYKWTVFYYEK